MTRRSQGFTLVEVLLALFLILLGVLAAAPMFMYAMKGNAIGKDLGSAGALAVERMEMLRTSDFASLPAGGSLASNVTGYSDTSNEDFDVRWLISNVAGPVDLKTIVVRVLSQRQAVSRPKRVTLVTLRSR